LENKKLKNICFPGLAKIWGGNWWETKDFFIWSNLGNLTWDEFHVYVVCVYSM
jgi:hypothetical protein